MIDIQHRRIGLPARYVLMAFIAIAIIPSIISSTILMLRYADSQRQQAERALIESAKGVARNIDSVFTVAIAALDTMKTSPQLSRTDLEPLENRLQSATADTGRPFAFVDVSGRQVISTVAPPRAPLSPEEIRRITRSTEQTPPVISDVIRDSGTGEPFAAISVPIVRDAAIPGFLVTFVYGADVWDLLNQPGVPDDWVVSIVDRQGVQLRRSHLNDRFAGEPLEPVLIEHMAAGGTGVLRAVSLEGIPLISTVAYASHSGWAAAIGLPVTQLEAPLKRSLQSLFVIEAVLALSALLFLYVIARTLNRGFRNVSEAARRLERGEIVDLPHSPIQEFDDVAATMTEVSHGLAEHNAALERRVAERTGELVAEMRRREESEAQLRQLHRMEAVGKLTGGIAHDFNNMLAVVMGALSLTQKRLARGDTDVARYVDNAMRGAENAAALTRRLLAFARQQTLSPETVDCNALISGMSDLLRRTIPESVEIEVVLAGGLWRVHVDAAGLENAILNLALNARDAMANGGKLTIETSNAHLDDAYVSEEVDLRPGQYVLVAVTDTGTGIDKDVLDRVFEPFFTTKKPTQGTGLGLSQVHGFIKQSGGHIRIYSEPDQGTSVKIYLPRLTHDVARSTARLDHRDDPMPDQSNAKILVVEDDDAVRAGTVEMLEELGYEVVQASNGQDALGVLEQHADIALLLTDVVMPGMNGRELADEAIRRAPHLQVLYTTGYTRNAIIHHGTLDPGVNLIAKPFTIATLGQRLSRLLRERTSG